MSHTLAQSFENVIRKEHELLRAITDEQAQAKPSLAGWSQKEELGHLIDSAANNHLRFVAGALGPDFRGPGYDQDNWVRLHGYNDLPWHTLVAFWHQYNSLLSHLVSRITEEQLQTRCTIGSGGPQPLRFIVEDYILHMQHHLDHILQREQITAYPSMATPAL